MKLNFSHDSAIPILCIYPREILIFAQKPVQKCYSNSTHKHQKIETIQTSFSK